MKVTNLLLKKDKNLIGPEGPLCKRVGFLELRSFDHDHNFFKNPYYYEQVETFYIIDGSIFVKRDGEETREYTTHDIISFDKREIKKIEIITKRFICLHFINTSRPKKFEKKDE